MKTHQLTEAQIERIIGLVEDAVGTALRAAVLEVVGHSVTEKKRQGRRPSADRDTALAGRIIAVLEAAPNTAKDAPRHLQGYLTCRSMPKTMLRKRVGNGYKGFDAVLEKLVTEGKVMTGNVQSLARRRMVLFGLP
jgi:hypothetical protein